MSVVLKFPDRRPPDASRAIRFREMAATISIPKLFSRAGQSKLGRVLIFNNVAF
jgi:hypothetical protein